MGFCPSSVAQIGQYPNGVNPLSFWLGFGPRACRVGIVFKPNHLNGAVRTEQRVRFSLSMNRPNVNPGRLSFGIAVLAPLAWANWAGINPNRFLYP